MRPENFSKSREFAVSTVAPSINAMQNLAERVESLASSGKIRRHARLTSLSFGGAALGADVPIFSKPALEDGKEPQDVFETK